MLVLAADVLQSAFASNIGEQGRRFLTHSSSACKTSTTETWRHGGLLASQNPAHDSWTPTKSPRNSVPQGLRGGCSWLFYRNNAREDRDFRRDAAYHVLYAVSSLPVAVEAECTSMMPGSSCPGNSNTFSWTTSQFSSWVKGSLGICLMSPAVLRSLSD